MITTPPGSRMLDLAVVLPLLVVSTPVCLVLMALIRMESAGSPLFAQRRVGRNGSTFTMLKLRTMRVGTPDKASHEVTPTQITRFGSILRRLKLDELPQLWNVACGEMSLIGPRPCLPNQHELVAERHSRGLLAIAPGITGPAQIRGIDMSNPRLLAAVEEEYFSRSRTVRDDVGLLLQTFAGGGRGDAALARAVPVEREDPERE